MTVDASNNPAPGAGPGTPATMDAPTGAGPRGSAPGAGMEMVRPPAYGRGIFVSLAAAAAVLALAIMASGETPTATGVPATETTTPLFWGLAVLFIIMAGAGAQYSELTASRAAASLGTPRRQSKLATAWAVPVVAVAAAILIVATYHNRMMLVAGPAIAFLGVAGGLLARDLLDDAADASARTASIIHTLVIHLVAFIALSAVYLNKMTPWVGAPLVGVFTFILLLEALDPSDCPLPSRVLYALLGAGVLAQATIVVSWWPTHGWTGGAALLVCFFAVAGILTVQVERKSVRDRDVLEYGAVTLAGLLILAFTM